MSEVQSRPAARGRGSARGGRGGHFARGGRGGARTTKTSSQENDVQPQSYEDEGDLGQLKKKHSNGLATIKELFPDWTDEDLVFALEDADGDLEVAIERITEGNVSQWGEVKKKTDRSRQKPKETQSASVDMTAQSARGGRGRGGFESRGRGRGDRGRAGRGGRAGGHVNGTTRPVQPSAQPQEAAESSTAAPVDTWPTDAPSNEANPPPSDSTATDASKPVEQPQKSTIIPEGSKKGWASLFAKPAPPPPQPQPQKEQPPQTTTTTTAAAEKPAEPTNEERFAEQPVVEPATVTKETKLVEPEPTPPTSLPAPTSHIENDIPSKPAVDEASKEPQLPQAAPVPVGEKEAVPQQQQQPQPPQQVRVPVPVPSYPYNKPAVSAGRTPNMQRRVMEQQEAVVMPANHAVDRAAVQFGSMGLNGSIDDVDIDEEREEPETRPQPPQHSPVPPRASFPPSTRAPAIADTTTTPAASRPAPGFAAAPPTTSAEAQFKDFARYGDTHQSYDPFAQQVEQQQQQVQEPFSNQGAIPSQPAAVTTAADYSAFYGADQSRNPYYYGSYGQPQEPAATQQQRVASGFGTTGAETQPQIPASQPPSRYGHVEAPNSGQNTPNPTLPAQVQSGQPSQYMPQGQGAHGAYNYAYPYYPNSHYPSAYMNQMTGQQHQYGRNRPMFDDVRRYEDSHYVPHGSQFGYGNQYAPYGKGGMYAQPQHGFTHDHSSSPANSGAFNQTITGRDAAYGRTGSTQPSEAQQTAGNSAFGGIPDVFGRTQSGFGHNQPMSSQQPVNTDESSNAKGFEAPKAGGPSPSVSHVNRPGSATSNVPTQPAAGQAGLPPVPAAQQANHQAFGGYPHLTQQQYGGLGGLGAHHQAGSHQGTGYGNYAAGFGSNYYGNTGRGGGWGGNYGH